jgi:hypothetical protein
MQLTSWCVLVRSVVFEPVCYERVQSQCDINCVQWDILHVLSAISAVQVEKYMLFLKSRNDPMRIQNRPSDFGKADMRQ